MWKRKKSAHWPHGGVNQHPAGGLLTPCTCVCPDSNPSVFPPIIWASNAVYLRRFLRHTSILVPDVQDPLWSDVFQEGLKGLGNDSVCMSTSTRTAISVAWCWKE